MYVIVAKKVEEGLTRGYQRENNHVVVTVPDEVALQDKLNELANEGNRENCHEIISVMWKV